MVFLNFIHIFLYIYTIFSDSLAEKHVPGYVVKNQVLTKGISFDDGLLEVNKEFIKNFHQIQIQINKPTSSVYVQCVICATVAQEFHINFFVIHNSDPPELKIPKHIIKELFENICDDSFVNFDLREFKTIKMLCQVTSDSKHVTTHFDGLWETMIRDMCWSFMQNYGIEYIYDVWFYGKKGNPNFQLIDALCRYYPAGKCQDDFRNVNNDRFRHGSLRYCRNINNEITPTSITTYQFPFNNTNTFTQYFK